MVESLRQELLDSYSDLTVTEDGERILIRGAYPILHNGEVLDRFQIEIRWPVTDRDPPTLREIGGRLPWVEDRHVNPTGEACPFVPEEWLLRPPETKTLRTFLDGPVRNFFILQVLRERGEPWPHGERSHGLRGLEEAYSEMLGMSDRAAIGRYLDCLSRKEIKGHLDCPCGSGKRLRNCHLEEVRNLRLRVPRAIAESALDRLNGARQNGSVTK
jgi:hypothetical protein